MSLSCQKMAWIMQKGASWTIQFYKGANCPFHRLRTLL
jgi:hypothetical protein